LNSLVDTSHLLSIGKIVGAHGIKGVVKVFSYAESANRYQSGMSLYLRDSRGSGFTVKILWAKPHSKTILLSLEGIADRSRAENLIGFDIFMDRALLEPLAKGTYYWEDLIGMSVYTVAGVYLGELTAVLPTGSNDVYVVRRGDGADEVEVLVPALASVVATVDLTQREMRVDLPEGL